MFCKEVTSDGADFKSKVRDNLLLVKILGFGGWEKISHLKDSKSLFHNVLASTQRAVIYPSLYKGDDSLNEKYDA